MASILGGIGTSHVPTIGIAHDKGKQQDPDWAPLFKGYEPVKKWLAEKKPDVLVFAFNDHATTFLFDLYPTFALGVSDRNAGLPFAHLCSNPIQQLPIMRVCLLPRAAANDGANATLRVQTPADGFGIAAEAIVLGIGDHTSTHGIEIDVGGDHAQGGADQFGPPADVDHRGRAGGPRRLPARHRVGALLSAEPPARHPQPGQVAARLLHGQVMLKRALASGSIAAAFVTVPQLTEDLLVPGPWEGAVSRDGGRARQNTWRAGFRGR